MSTADDDKVELSKTSSDDITLNSTRYSGDCEGGDKIVFLLHAAGGAPILKKKRWSLSRTKTIGHIVEFLKKYMKLTIEEQKQLVLYVNQTFAPAFDTTIGAVNDCFNSEGILVLHYALTPAWG